MEPFKVSEIRIPVALANKDIMGKLRAGTENETVTTYKALRNIAANDKYPEVRSRLGRLHEHAMEIGDLAPRELYDNLPVVVRPGKANFLLRNKNNWVTIKVITIDRNFAFIGNYANSYIQTKGYVEGDRIDEFYEYAVNILKEHKHEVDVLSGRNEVDVEGSLKKVKKVIEKEKCLFILSNAQPGAYAIIADHLKGD